MNLWVINGTDYSVVVIGVVSFLVLFGVQYGICLKAKSKILRFALWGYVGLILLLAVLCALDGDSSGFIIISGFIALILLGYALIFAGAIICAWLVYKWRRRAE